MNHPVMRAKFLVTHVVKQDRSETVNFTAVPKNGGYPEDGSDEDNTFAKWTPSAQCSIQITNPELFGRFEAGQKFHVDFTQAQ